MQMMGRNSSARPLRASPATFALLAASIAALFFVACGGEDSGSGANGPRATADGGDLSGIIQGDGSSTVFPISEAMAEEFGKENPGVDPVVAQSGTSGGFEKFCNGETDFNDASRPIEEDEQQACQAKGIDWVELQVGFDGLSVVVNPSLDFVDCLTIDQLKQIWQPGSTINNWNAVDPTYPNQALPLYGPGTDSGTFDYFTKEIIGEEGASRSDYQASEDDNQLVQGVTTDEGALGYFGFAYYEQNQARLKLLGVDSGQGCVQPSRETILDGTYAPLSRPLFVYFRKDALDRPEVRAFAEFYLDKVTELVPQVGYVEPDAETLDQQVQKLATLQ